jgi:hypothetical protein
MTVNEGVFDRVVRITVGYLVLCSFFLIDGNLKWLALIGIAPLVTGLLGRCPAYLPFGFSTCARRS